MNQKKKIKLVATIIIMSIILIMIICAYTNKISKNKLKQNDINALNSGKIITIDITGITPSPESQHEHIYITLYDDTKHWEQCTVCPAKRNEQTHSIVTTWALGYVSCNKENSYTKTCTCGYSYIGHRPCVWTGKYNCNVYDNGYYHSKICKICNGGIRYSYYMNTYGNGEVYYIDHENSDVPGFEEFESCTLSNGSRINCTNLGSCSKCKTNRTKQHRLRINETTKEIYCMACKNIFGTATEDIDSDYNSPTTYTSTMKVIFTNKNVKFKSTDGLRDVGGMWDTNIQNVSNKNSASTEFTVITKGTYKSIIKEKHSSRVIININMGGTETQLFGKEFIAFPDLIKPEISNIQVQGNEWTKFKSITIIGKENYCNTVNVKIENDRGRVVFEGGVNVTNNNWSISCIPELEAGENGRTFTVTVTDSCDNSVTKTFNISKVDGKPPTVTSSDMATDREWAKEKTFTFTAEDLGIGNVEIGFNDVNDYSLAVQDGTNYSKEYKFVGDAYSPVKASVYFKDGLGNIVTQLVTLEKIDNTAPTITNASLNNNVVSITAHDRHSTLGEGSGVEKYRYITSTEKLENPEITPENSQEVNKDELFTIPNINEVKYIYVVAEDAVRKHQRKL